MEYKSPVKITDEVELAKYTWLILQHYEEHGFPHFSMSYEKKLLEFSSFQRLDRNSLFDGKTIKQAQHGLGVIWSYFPHHWNVKCNRNLTVMEAWSNEAKRKQAVEKSLKLGRYEILDGKPFLGNAKMRAAIAYVSGVQRVSNFRPSAAALIYDKFSHGAVWDMSSGYGGRLFGAIASPSVHSYIGTDPDFDTFIGLQRLKDDFSHITKTEVTVVNKGSEDYAPDKGSIDLCFTSPPYFDTEKYSDDVSQSWKKFPTVAEWNEGFLRATIENVYYALKSGGLCIFNVANTKTHETLEADLVNTAGEAGLKLRETLKLGLSSMAGGIKTEPLFVFEK